MNGSLVRSAHNALYNTIHNDGKTVYIKHFLSSACRYCTVDPVSKAGRFNCSTCNGIGYWRVSTAVAVKGIVNTFPGNMGFIKYGNDKIDLLAVGQARVTIWLKDVLLNPYSHTSRTYLDSADSIRIGGDYYAVKDYSRVGITDEANLCVITLERK